MTEEKLIKIIKDTWESSIDKHNSWEQRFIKNIITDEQYNQVPTLKNFITLMIRKCQQEQLLEK